MSYAFDPHFNGGQRNNVVIVGCGGTGAHAARLVARIIYDMERRRMQQIPDLILIDPDTIEAKNVGRQLFSPAEIGLNKAVVVMRRLRAALGIKCKAIPKGVTVDMLSGAKIVVGCVDNHEARAVIAAAVSKRNPSQFNDSQPLVWVDAGNTRNSGQVIIGDCANDALIKPGAMDRYKHLPMPSYLYPTLLQPEPTPDTTNLSCAELLELGEQDLLINDWMGIIAAQYVKQLLYMQPITSFVTWVAPEFNMTRSTEISPANLANVMERNR